MSAAVQDDWKTTARELREAGLSEREIAQSVGKANSTVHKYLKEAGVEPAGDAEPEAAAEPEAEFFDPAASEPEQRRPNTKGVPPFQVEKARLEQGAITESGDTIWESESVYVPLSEIRLDGTAQLSMFDVGGKRATESSLRLQGGRVMLTDGQAFRKGDVVRLQVTAVVREVAQRDKPDPATGIVVSAEQKHVAYITDLRVLS